MNTETENVNVDSPSPPVEQENNDDKNLVITTKLNAALNDVIRADMDLETVISKLRIKDPTSTEIMFYNSNVLTQKENNFLRLFGALQDNEHLKHVHLVNVNMKDADCLLLMEALINCLSLETLNLESNELSNIGIEFVAERCEKLPRLRELRVANQRMPIGIEGERALANCLSQNPTITKLSYVFRDNLVGVQANKFIQRNIDIVRQNRNNLKNSVQNDMFKPEPPVYARKEIPSDLKIQAREQLTAIVIKTNKAEDSKNITKALPKQLPIEPSPIPIETSKVEIEYVCGCFAVEKTTVTSKMESGNENFNTNETTNVTNLETQLNNESVISQRMDRRDSTQPPSLLPPQGRTSVHRRDSTSSTLKSSTLLSHTLTEIMEKLKSNDSNLIEINLNNSHILSQNANNYKLLSDALLNNTNILVLEIANVGMKDNECIILMKAISTCTSLEILNLETNCLSSTGFEAIANMLEPHPSIIEVRIANQKMSVGVTAERALVNALSQNVIIKKLSYTFQEKNMGMMSDKYIQRNIDINRKAKFAAKNNENFEMKSKDPYPFPKTNDSEVASTVSVAIEIPIKSRTNSTSNSPLVKSRSDSNSPLVKSRTDSTANSPLAKPRTDSTENSPLVKPRTDSTANSPLVKPRTDSTANSPLVKPRTDSTANSPLVKPRTDSTANSPLAKPRTDSTANTPLAKPRTDSTANNPLVRTSISAVNS